MEEEILRYIKKNLPTIDRNLVIMNHYLTVEISMALEELGVLEYAASRESFFLHEVTETFDLKLEPLRIALEFLTEQGLIKKIGRDQFRLAFDRELLRWLTGFPLTYRNVFRDSRYLLDGSKVYGRDILRNEEYLRTTKFLSKGSIPFLVKRFRELNIKNVVTIGWDDHELLSTAQKFMPGLRGIGIDVPEGQRTFPRNLSKHTFTIAEGSTEYPELFPRETTKADAIVETLVFHEFLKEQKSVPLLNKYKTRFPSARLFMVEFEDVSWDTILQRPEGTSGRTLASLYKLLHTLINPGLLPQSSKDLIAIVNQSNWRIVNVLPTAPKELLVYECE